MNCKLETEYQEPPHEKPTVTSNHIPDSAFGPCSTSKGIPRQNFSIGKFSPEIKCADGVLKAKGLVKTWFVHYAWPGMGLFGESYLLFSIGTLRPIWESLYPNCFSFEECSPGLLHSLTYSVVVGIIFGMLVVGYWSDDFGRRKGSILTASLMTGGAVGLFLITFMKSPNSVFRGMSGLLFIFGIGVGGEYPLSAASASEKATQRHLGTYDYYTRQEESTTSQNKDKLCLTGEMLESTGNTCSHALHEMRGRRVQLVFSMQGLGIWFNSIVITILLFITGQTKTNNYDQSYLIAIWRISYLIGAVILAFVLISRCLYLEESRVWEEDKLKRKEYGQSISDSLEKRTKPNPSVVLKRKILEENLSHLPYHSFANKEEVVGSRMIQFLKDYGSRLLGASISWFLWDITFYGNKLFQSSFLLALTGEETSLFLFSFAATINSTIALFGYFGAAVLLDRPGIGRLRLQIAGFLLTGLMFVLCGLLFDRLSSKWIVMMYFSSSLFGQLGPNSTTFLIPAEIFPTEMRTFCHGISAASGKMGALFAAILFNFIDEDLELFLISGYASVLAALVSVWASPDTTEMNILELDRKWRMTLAGEKYLYKGVANHPKHWSMYEKLRHRRQLNLEEVDHAQLQGFA